MRSAEPRKSTSLSTDDHNIPSGHFYPGLSPRPSFSISPHPEGGAGDKTDLDVVDMNSSASHQYL